MMTLERFHVKFWGVRGSIPCPGAETVRYGGNTTCVEMLIGGERLVFDSGTGIRILGESLLPLMPVQGHLFFSHTHWDHIQGFPFFAPALGVVTPLKFTGFLLLMVLRLNNVCMTKCFTLTFQCPCKLCKVIYNFMILK